jgi:hypothetical protein
MLKHVMIQVEKNTNFSCLDFQSNMISIILAGFHKHFLVPHAVSKQQLVAKCFKMLKITIPCPAVW